MVKKITYVAARFKEEYETKGRPKQPARRLQMEASQRAMQQAQAIEDVKDATVVITNPTHFAVAIKYNPDEDTVPLILAMGRYRCKTCN